MDYIAEPATDMSHTSDWPLPADSLRLPIPAALLEKLAVHPLSRDLYPHLPGPLPARPRPPHEPRAP